jgi:hypothetical protein
MTGDSIDHQRRSLFLSAAGLAVGFAALNPLSASVSASEDTPEKSSMKLPANHENEGKVGEFNFLAGSWKISHRRLKESGGKEWDEFPGEATCWTVLGGIGSIEELRIPARNFSGLGIRLLDVEKRVWSDFWVNARSGVLLCPGMTGSFRDGVGTFIADDVDDGHPIQSRGVWDRITPTSCRWHQAISRDGGKVWEENWIMDWSRV